MKGQSISIVVIAISLCVVLGVAFAAQDKYSLTVPNGLAFAEFRGYEGWQDVAVSETASSVKAKRLGVRAIYLRSRGQNFRPFGSLGNWPRMRVRVPYDHQDD
jgi:hypothetical protein